ncbi:hypothetical protein Hamer_G018719, partial [Homarus americanus]
ARIYKEYQASQDSSHPADDRIGSRVGRLPSQLPHTTTISNLYCLSGFVVGAPSNNGFVRHAAPYSSYITYGQTKPPPYSSPRRRVNHKDFMQNALKKQAMLQRQQQMILQEVRELKQQLDSNSFTAPSARSTIHLNKPAELTSLSYTIADIIKQLTGNTNPGLRIPTPDLLPGKINLLVATDPHDDDSEEVTQPLLLAPRPPVTHVFITSDPQERSTPAFRFSEPDSQEQLKSLDGVVSLVEDSYTDDSEEESTGRKIQIENIPTQDQAASEALIEVLEPNTTPDVELQILAVSSVLVEREEHHQQHYRLYKFVQLDRAGLKASMRQVLTTLIQS